MTERGSIDRDDVQPRQQRVLAIIDRWLEQRLRVSIAAVAALAVVGGCADDDGGGSLNIDDEMLIAVVGDCVEFNLSDNVSEYRSSSCVANVGGDVLGPPDSQWFTGFAPAETEVIESGGAVEDRFLEFEDLKVFAVRYESGMEVAALNSDGRELYTYTTPDE